MLAVRVWQYPFSPFVLGTCVILFCIGSPITSPVSITFQFNVTLRRNRLGWVHNLITPGAPRKQQQACHSKGSVVAAVSTGKKHMFSSTVRAANNSLASLQIQQRVPRKPTQSGKQPAAPGYGVLDTIQSRVVKK